MTLSGITFTTADGETIELDKKYISEEEKREIIQLHSEEIRERTFRKNIVKKGFYKEDKNGKAFKWSKNRIWRENILKYEGNFGLKADRIDDVILLAIRDIQGAFDSKIVENKASEMFCDIQPGDSPQVIKKKNNMSKSFRHAVSIRLKVICYALGCTEDYELAHSLDIKEEMERILKEDDPLMIRYKKPDTRFFTYEKTPSFGKYSHEKLSKIVAEFAAKYNRESRKNNAAKKDNNAKTVERKTEIIEIVKKEADTDFVVESKPEQKDLFIDPTPTITLPTKDQLSEKAAITRYIVDKILESPKPGTTMKINNDASIEFKF